MAINTLSALWIQAAPAGGGGLGLVMILAVFAIFYFLLIMPVQRRQKRVQKMHSELKTGDKVVTSGGIRGTIVSLKDDSMHLQIGPDRVKLEFVRSAVAQVLSEPGAK